METETITAGGIVLAHLIRVAELPDETVFPTPDDAPLQVGFVVRRAGQSVERHVHHPLERRLTGTPEVLIVRRGTCRVDLYDDERVIVATRTMGVGDILITCAGGHGFHMDEDTVLMEVKQGPYAGPDEKERF